MNNSILFKIIHSSNIVNEGINTISEILGWLDSQTNNSYVKIQEKSIYDNDFWFYDDYRGEVMNRKRSFFSIIGMRRFENDSFSGEQPIIVQPEIGYLGIICKEIEGVLHFLMQAKIEPGNVNHVQISPTIQATKSNFLRVHGGRLPQYFEFFEQSGRYHVIYDQIQSEQGSRFYKKRNRNMIMEIFEDIDVYPNFMWMTLGQIKELMHIDNIVNMDTRTVLSGLPFVQSPMHTDGEMCRVYEAFQDKPLFESMFSEPPENALPEAYRKINNYKMFNDIKVVSIPLNQLVDWEIDEYGIRHKKKASFQVKYYDIEISGREVREWFQPLFAASGKAVFALLTKIINEKREFLVQIKAEIGSFDMIELGPSIQWEPTHSMENDNDVDLYYRTRIKNKENILIDVVLSEEGGRFYHEQNINQIVDVEPVALESLPDNYFWVDYATLYHMITINNCINIQLRNLMSLLEY